MARVETRSNQGLLERANRFAKGTVLSALMLTQAPNLVHNVNADEPVNEPRTSQRTSGIELAANKIVTKQAEAIDPYAALDALVQTKELTAEKINPAFKDSSYRNNLTYIMERIQDAKTRGLRGVDLNEVFSLHPVAAHALVRSAYVTYQSLPVFQPEKTKEVLDSSFVQNFGQKSKPTRQDAKKFVDLFVGRFVIPAMQVNYTEECIRTNASYTQKDVQQKTLEGYNLKYRDKYDDISFSISDAPPNSVTLRK